MADPSAFGPVIEPWWSTPEAIMGGKMASGAPTQKSSGGRRSPPDPVLAPSSQAPREPVSGAGNVFNPQSWGWQPFDVNAPPTQRVVDPNTRQVYDPAGSAWRNPNQQERQQYQSWAQPPASYQTVQSNVPVAFDFDQYGGTEEYTYYNAYGQIIPYPINVSEAYYYPEGLWEGEPVRLRHGPPPPLTGAGQGTGGPRRPIPPQPTTPTQPTPVDTGPSKYYQQLVASGERDVERQANEQNAKIISDYANRGVLNSSGTVGGISSTAGWEGAAKQDVRRNAAIAEQNLELARQAEGMNQILAGMGMAAPGYSGSLYQSLGSNAIGAYSSAGQLQPYQSDPWSTFAYTAGQTYAGGGGGGNNAPITYPTPPFGPSEPQGSPYGTTTPGHYGY